MTDGAVITPSFPHNSTIATLSVSSSLLEDSPLESGAEESRGEMGRVEERRAEESRGEMGRVE